MEKNRDTHPLAEDGDLVAIDDEFAIGVVNITFEDTMNGIIFEHINHVFKVDEAVEARREENMMVRIESLICMDQQMLILRIFVSYTYGSLMATT